MRAALVACALGLAAPHAAHADASASASAGGDAAPAHAAARAAAARSDRAGGVGAAAAPRETAGARLRAGVEALAARRFDEALAHLREVERRWPFVADHAARLAIEAQLGAGRAQEALVAARAFAARYPDSPLRGRVARLRGDAAREAGAREEARAAWREALAATADPARQAELLAALAAAAEEAGDLDEAASSWREAWIAAPLSPQAAAAEPALARLEAAGAPARDAPAWSRRGDALLAAGDHAGALAAFERAGALDPVPALADALRRQRARALFRARRYPEARAAFAALGDDAEARLFTARAAARSGATDEAVAAFEAIAASGSPFAAQARLLAATLLDDEPDTEERAVAHYRALAEGAGDPALRRDAGWRLAWLRYRAGRHAEAAGHLERLADGEPEALEALRLRYWALRARERAGGGAEVVQGYAELAAAYPLSYYGWRAGQRARAADGARAAVTAAGAASAGGEGALAGGAGPAPTGARAAQALDDGALARVEALLEATLREEADAELEALAAPDLGDPDRVRLASLAARAGNFERARTIAASGREEALARGPAAGDAALWRLAWPRAYEEVVAAATADVGVRPELVWAVMREESAFRPDALSPVGARGLLQLMPETAARAAAELGLPRPGPEALYTPSLNVRLGVRVLGGLVREFEGALAAAIGGYNAGAGAVVRWRAEARELAEDEWIEAIPYDETRAYVRRVLRSVHAYEALY